MTGWLTFLDCHWPSSTVSPWNTNTSVSAVGGKQSIGDHRAAWTYVNVRISYVTSVRVGARVWSTGADRDSAVCLAACRASTVLPYQKVSHRECITPTLASLFARYSNSAMRTAVWPIAIQLLNPTAVHPSFLARVSEEETPDHEL